MHSQSNCLSALCLAAGAALAFLFIPAPASGQTNEPVLTRLASDIRDEAGLFSREAVSRAKERLAAVEVAHHVPTIVATIDSLGGSTVETATIERARKANFEGIYILIAKRETKIDAIRAPRLANVIIPADLHTIRDAVISEFAKRDFDAGLAHGVDAIEKVLSEAKAKGRGVPAASGNLVLRNQVRLTLDGAKKIIAGAAAKAHELKLNMNIAVVDDGGHMIAFERMDGARPASAYTATTKAITAATFRQATGPLGPKTEAPDVLLNLSLQNAAAASGGKVTTLYGGVPVVVDGQVIAGVGVGGGTGEQDATVARAGIAAFMAEVEGHSPPSETPQQPSR